MEAKSGSPRLSLDLFRTSIDQRMRRAEEREHRYEELRRGYSMQIKQGKVAIVLRRDCEPEASRPPSIS